MSDIGRIGAQAFTGSKDARPELERAFNTSSDLGAVAVTLSEEGMDGILNFRVKVGSPIRVMAAQRLSDAEEVIEKLGGHCSAEYKLDGERFQIHKDGDAVSIFSRRLENITHMYPDAVKLTREQITNGGLEGTACCKYACMILTSVCEH